VIEELGTGPKTAWWIAANMKVSVHWVDQTIKLAIYDGFVEERGIEYLYPQTDRRDGVRRKRGKRLKTWTHTRMYYALSHVGRVLLPLESMRLGAVE
jgi:hypothetical protein